MEQREKKKNDQQVNKKNHLRFKVTEMKQLSNYTRCIITGCSGSGKTELVSNIIRRRRQLFDQPFEKIIYCTRVRENIPKDILADPSVYFHQGLPDQNTIDGRWGVPKDSFVLLVIDDGFLETLGSSVISTLFTEVCIKKNLLREVIKAETFCKLISFI